MTTIELTVWAPSATAVQVEVAPTGEPAQLLDAARTAGGWWQVQLPDAPEVVDYAFRIDGGDALPDPRSAWQPFGVHGRSRTFDPHLFDWTDEQWPGPCRGAGVLGAVCYELHVGTFTAQGTLDAARERLPHLVDLGVDVVELLPLAAFPGDRGWGYDGVFPYAVHDAYGGPAALQRFVDACHGAGLAVCLDVVHNHLGPVGNYLSRFGPYFSTRHETPWGPAVNLDGEGSENVRRFLLDSALRWFRDFHVDALRLDAVHELPDDSPQHLLAQLADETASLSSRLDRPLSLIAESDLNDPVMITPTGEGGRGMTAQWDDDVHHALHVLLTGEEQGYYADFTAPDALWATLTRAFFHDGRWSSFRGSHWGRAVDPATVDGRRFVAYLQTHDQVGNRATGDRIHAGMPAGRQAIGAALYLTSAFTPMLFMGEEWAASTPWQFFTSFEDEVGALVREGRRAEFARHGWSAQDIPDPQDPATRDASVLRWAELSEPAHARMLGWYRDLIALRRHEESLTDGRLDLVHVYRDAPDAVVVARGRLRVVANLAAEATTVPVRSGSATVPDVLLAFDPAQVRVEPDAVGLGGNGVAVLRV